jgi:DNA repair protein RecO (recombination protein O)
LFTRDFGKIAAMAKGARRAKGPFDSALDLLTVCRVVFIHKSSDALDLLTEAKLERRFRSATRDLSRLYAGYYVAELLTELTDMGDPHPELYHEAERTLANLDQEGDVAEILLKFELSTLRFLGYLPTLDGCARCGADTDAANRVLFGHLAGGILCPKCRPGERQVVSLSREGLETLRLASDPTADELPGFSDTRVRGELRGLMNHYLSHIMGHLPRMQKYLGTLAT